MTATLTALAQELTKPVPYNEETDDSIVPTAKEVHIPAWQNKLGQLGVGLQAGVQSGLTIEYWTAESRALDATLTTESGNIVLGLAHLWMFRGAFPGDADPLVTYLGFGALGFFGNRGDYLVHEDKNFIWALQAPVGFEYLLEKKNYSFFIEAVPGMQFSPISRVFIGADAGFHFYF